MKKLFICFLMMSLIPAAFAQQRQDWAQFARYEQENARIGPPVRAVFMGNSITANWTKMDSAFFARNRFAGRGISGQTSSEMLVRFRQDVIGLSPETVVIMAGTNDLARNNGYITLENILGNIISMCELARQNDIKPVLCSVLPAYRFGWRPEVDAAALIVELNRMIRDYAESHKIPYVDYYSALADERGGLPEKLSGDGVHPNPDCYKIMEEIVLPVIGPRPSKKTTGKAPRPEKQTR